MSENKVTALLKGTRRLNDAHQIEEVRKASCNDAVDFCEAGYRQSQKLSFAPQLSLD